MLTNIWEDFIQFLTALILGTLDKMSAVVTYAFSPQLTVFAHTFPNASVLYRRVQEVAIVIAIVIFIYKIFVMAVTPKSKEYESPFILLWNFVKFLIYLSIFPTIINTATEFTNIVYWELSTSIDEDFTDATGTVMWSSMFDGLQNVVNGNYAEPQTATEQAQTLGFGDKVKLKWNELGIKFNEMLRNGAIISGGDPTAANQRIADLKEQRAAIDPGFNPNNLDEGLLAGIVSIILVLAVAINYFIYIIEMAERYVVYGCLTFFAPLGFAPVVSESTKHITKKYFQMWISELLILVFSGVFLALFRSAVSYGVSSIYSGTLYITNPVDNNASIVGGAFVWTLLLLALLKVGQRIDAYLNSMGLSAAQTGGELGQTVTGTLKTLGYAGLQLGRAASSKRSAATREAAARNGGVPPRTKADMQTVNNVSKNAQKVGAERLEAMKSGDPEKLKKAGESQVGLTADNTKRMTSAEMQQACADAGGLAGRDAAAYSQRMFQTDAETGYSGLIPKDATITNAKIGKFDTDTGSYADSQISFMADGKEHTYNLTSNPEDGRTYIATNAAGEQLTDAAGQPVYATDVTGISDAANEEMAKGIATGSDAMASDAFSGADEKDLAEQLGLSEESGMDGTTFQRNDDGTVNITGDDGTVFENARMEDNGDGTYSIKDENGTVGATAELNSDGSYTITDNNGNVIADNAQVSDNNDATWNIRDSAGNTVAENAHKTYDMQEAYEAACDPHKAVSWTDDGGAIVADKNDFGYSTAGGSGVERMQNFDNSKIDPANGSISYNDAATTESYRNADIANGGRGESYFDYTDASGNTKTLSKSQLESMDVGFQQGSYCVYDGKESATAGVNGGANAPVWHTSNGDLKSESDVRNLQKSTHVSDGNGGYRTAASCDKDYEAPDTSASATRSRRSEAREKTESHIRESAASGYQYTGRSFDSAANVMLGADEKVKFDHSSHETNRISANGDVKASIIVNNTDRNGNETSRVVTGICFSKDASHIDGQATFVKATSGDRDASTTYKYGKAREEREKKTYTQRARSQRDRDYRQAGKKDVRHI